MDPSLGTVKDGTAKASESTTNGGWEIFRLRGKAEWSAHPGEWSAHLYCIGDETLIRNPGGESDAAIAKMKRFGGQQRDSVASHRNQTGKAWVRRGLCVSGREAIGYLK